MKNKRLKSALIKSILVFATLHIVILIYLAVTTGNLTYINVFSILDLQVFFPGIEQGVASSAISALIVATIFMWFYSKGD